MHLGQPTLLLILAEVIVMPHLLELMGMGGGLSGFSFLSCGTKQHAIMRLKTIINRHRNKANK